jgi:hypothetical protein
MRWTVFLGEGRRMGRGGRRCSRCLQSGGAASLACGLCSREGSKAELVLRSKGKIQGGALLLKKEGFFG